MGTLLNGAGDLESVDANYELLNATFASIFITGFSQASVINEKLEGGEELLAVDEDQDWYYLKKNPPSIRCIQGCIQGC